MKKNNPLVLAFFEIKSISRIPKICLFSFLLLSANMTATQTSKEDWTASTLEIVSNVGLDGYGANTLATEASTSTRNQFQTHLKPIQDELLNQLKYCKCDSYITYNSS